MLILWYNFFFFFFQAEDGIRDKLVTGVQTCALPIAQGEREEQVDDRDDDRVDERREEPADPVLLQGRVMSDQVNGRRHDSPIRGRQYPTGLHKCIGRIMGELYSVG